LNYDRTKITAFAPQNLEEALLTMTSRMETAESIPPSQGRYMDSPIPQREMFDASQLTIGEFSLSADLPDESQEAVEDSQESQATGTAATTTTTTTASSRRSRKRQSFSNKKLLANKELFLKPSAVCQFSDESLELIGQIKECPRKANGYLYRVDWRKNGGKPLPSLLQRDWLQEYFLLVHVEQTGLDGTKNSWQ
jgi:hypothetical protein